MYTTPSATAAAELVIAPPVCTRQSSTGSPSGPGPRISPVRARLPRYIGTPLARTAATGVAAVVAAVALVDVGRAVAGWLATVVGGDVALSLPPPQAARLNASATSPNHRMGILSFRLP